jgi:SAM-dependent methyltransferase
MNPAFDYDAHGKIYSGFRRTDPRIAEYVNKFLGDARTVLNVGAGTGSYEPEGRYVMAVEPSAVMRAQRKSINKIPAINAKADSLPFDDRAFDASMAMLTVHHWPDLEKGLSEVQRVTDKRILILTYDPAALHEFWNIEYFPDLIEVEKQRYPEIERIKRGIGGRAEVVPIPVPFDCVDGFQEAFYGRPEAFLDEEIRKAQSAWGFLPPGKEEEHIKSLSAALASGSWDKKYGHYRKAPFFSGALRLIVAELLH